jgi:hypothetical protein
MGIARKHGDGGRARAATKRGSHDDTPNALLRAKAAGFTACTCETPVGNNTINSAAAGVTTFGLLTDRAAFATVRMFFQNLPGTRGKAAATAGRALGPLAPGTHQAVHRTTTVVASNAAGQRRAGLASRGCLLVNFADPLLNAGAACLGAVAPCMPRSDDAVGRARLGVALPFALQLWAFLATVYRCPRDAPVSNLSTTAAALRALRPRRVLGNLAIDGAVVFVAHLSLTAAAARFAEVLRLHKDTADAGLDARTAAQRALGPLTPGVQDTVLLTKPVATSLNVLQVGADVSAVHPMSNDRSAAGHAAVTASARALRPSRPTRNNAVNRTGAHFA